MKKSDDQDSNFDYIIVGSGAGGAPLAARLARAGKRVLVIEAGPNHADATSTEPAHEVSRVPALHGVSTEHPDLAWRFFVEHYETLPDGVASDPKYHKHNPAAGQNKTHDGIFYPRATGIGGCTIHNAMITIAGPDADWDDMADLIGDDSWRAPQMRAYFQRLEHNDYQKRPRPPVRTQGQRLRRYVKDLALWFVSGRDPDGTSGRHGFSGWLHTSVADLRLGLGDKQLIRVLAAALWQARLAGLDRAWSSVKTFLRGDISKALDPNHQRTQQESPEGVVIVPIAVHGKGTTIHQDSSAPFTMLGRRSSPREFLLSTLALHPSKLTIWTDCFVTKVLFDGGTPPRAVGVEYLRGKRLYRAHVNPDARPDELQEVRVAKGGEVVLCGGTFNTPQLLMLSGIGDPDQLANVNKSGKEIKCLVPLPGVGKNLQDRYEVSLVSEMERDFSLLADGSFSLPADPTQPDWLLREWREAGTGLYASNGSVLGIFKRSNPDLPQPDLFIFGIPLEFKGYSVNYSKVGNIHDQFTWVILKSHSTNRDGEVNLRSLDPLDTPLVNFHYFNEVSHPGRTAEDPDVLALVEGVKFVRGITKCLGKRHATEIHPGYDLVPDNSVEQMKKWIRRDAWGHHACGTCRMGRDEDPYAVLDSRFRVRGVKGLRVVDASIFPKIPGYFIVTNLYMASEKAADVLIEDSKLAAPDSPIYPQELRKRETEAIQTRRKVAKLADTEVVTGDDWSEDLTGLALSGGGIRSATYCLGVLQTLAKTRILRRFDIMSTVSGGSYIGSSLGRFYDHLRVKKTDNPITGETVPPATRVENELSSNDSPFVSWLRRHGNYIAPQGGSDARVNVAIYLRNLLSVHLVVGSLIFAMLGIANLIRYGLFDNAFALAGFVINSGDLPIGHAIEMAFGPFYSSWFILAEGILLILIIPRIVAYWIVSQDEHETFKCLPMVILYLFSALLLWLGAQDGLHWEPVLFAIALLISPIQVEFAWWRGNDREAAVGTGGVEAQRLRTRTYLTEDLGLALVLAGLAIGFTAIDTVGHAIQQWAAGNNTYTIAFSSLFASIATVIPATRFIISYVSDFVSSSQPTRKKVQRLDAIAVVLAVVLLALPLVSYSFASHAAYGGGDSLLRGALWTTAALAFSILAGLPGSLPFINRSSLSQSYSARLARAYLGAANPLRYRASGMNVSEVMPGDDVASIRDYRPHEASGPLHIINVSLNETMDTAARRRRRDRQGDILAVSSIGVTIGERWHSGWAEPSQRISAVGRKVPARLEPLGRKPGVEHPLVDELDQPADAVQMLSLREWLGISGAAMDPGRGKQTNLGIALLFGLLNIRTGYWWDTGIFASGRSGFPNVTFLRRALYLFPRLFQTQSLLLYEWLAHYPGPWERFWHLSDGGNFDNTGAYELIRRKVPRILLCDGTQDPSYTFESFAELIRKCRVDLGAHIQSFSDDDFKKLVDNRIRKCVGTYDEIRAADADIESKGHWASKHAALFWVHYEGSDRRSVLLYLKATMTGDEPLDVLQYRTEHPSFPQESTGDQFFDEAQWESYRRLGEHLAHPLFSSAPNSSDSGEHALDWFWQIPLTSEEVIA